MDLFAREFLTRFANLSDNMRQQGYRFERLTQEWLTHAPIHRDKYKKIWLWSDWASSLSMDRTDTGIDLVAETHDGEYCAIQCKNYNLDNALPLGNLTNFTSALSSEFGGKKFTSGIVVTTAPEWSKNANNAIENLTIPCQRIDFIDELSNADIDWAAVNNLLPHDEENAISEKLIATSFPATQTVDLDDLLEKLFPDTEKSQNTPRPHQIEAINSVIAGFQTADRGKMIMACGTGKTFTALKIAEKITAGKNGNILFLVPSLSLLSQALNEWSRERENPLRAFAVCSDRTVGRQDEDDISARDLAIPATTESKKLSAKLKNSSERMSVIFATYQSIAVIAEAQQQGAPDFDLIICDEAHRTTGVEKQQQGGGTRLSHFVKVHDGEYIRAAKRLYMTATPRIYSDTAKSKANELEIDYYSMDDPEQYGEEFYRLGFAQAVEKKLLSDYKVLIVAIDKERITPAMLATASEIEITQTGRGKKYEVDNEGLVKLIGCWQGLSKDIKNPALALDPSPMRRAVMFSNTINASLAVSKLFANVIDQYNGVGAEDENSEGKDFLRCQVKHVDGTQDALQRNEKLNWLKQSPDGNGCHILSNVRCLSEGVDVPALDAVAFLSPRNSQVDIVQSVGRVMRTAPGKKEGYIILPVIASEGEDAGVALEKNESYRVVWDTLKALRSHDERLDVEINQLDLNKKRSQRIIITSEKGDDEKGKGGGEGIGALQDEIKLLFDRTKFENAIYAAIVKKCGDRKYIEIWAKDVAKVAKETTARIEELLINDANAKAQYAEFLSGLQKNINPLVTSEAATEMLAQHLITRPIFDTLFGSEDFVGANPVSKTMQAMLNCFDQKNIVKETDGLEAFYQDMNRYLGGIDNPKGKQAVISELYEKFFKNAFPKMAESLGIVYTPIEVVDFMIRSIDDLLKQEFGRGIGDEKVNLLDPFTGTGTFITRLLESNTIADKDLQRKYQSEIHANEIILLAYYIAAINIEQSYQARLADSQKTDNPLPYEPFSGIALTDTFQINESDDASVQKPIGNVPPLQQNSERIERQRNTPITVIFGNPPYSAHQKSENDANKNLKYQRLDASISNSYVKHTNATNKNSLYDSYIRAIRWASNRIGDEGIVAYISNGSYIDGNAMDGLRKCLADEFNSIYCFNLRGNTRAKEWKKEGGKIFGGGSRTTAAILLLVKNPKATGNNCQIFYHDIGDYLDRQQKLKIISEFATIKNIPWQTIRPDENNDWVNQQNRKFSTYLSMGEKKNKRTGSVQTPSVFTLFSNGLVTSRDAWVYAFSQAQLAENMQSMSNFYNSEVQRYQTAKPSTKVDSFVTSDTTKISWSSSLKDYLRRGIAGDYQKKNIRLGLYRPFTKQHLYFDNTFIHRPAIANRYFPTANTENLAIYVAGGGASVGFSALMVNSVPNRHFLDTGECFPRYTFIKNTFPAAVEQYERIDNIPPATVTTFRKQYNDESINGDHIFYYVYGILHNREYKTKFANDLKKTLPRIPFAKSVDDFKAYSTAGKQLADLHVNYETAEPYPLFVRKNNKTESANYFAVHKMKYPNKNERTTIIYNANITIKEIPPEAQQYIVNGKPALNWIMDRYQVKTDKDSQLTNDPNQWSDDPRYIIELIRKVTTVSVQTVKIVDALPML